MQHALGPRARNHNHERVVRPARTVRPIRHSVGRSVRPPQIAPTSPLGRLAAIARLRALHEVAIVAVATFLYFFVRGLMDGQEARAFANADRVIEAERAIGLFHEPRFQAWALRYEWLQTLANWVYIWGHWPVIIGTLVWLLAKHRDQYGVYRNALLVSGGIGLVFFVVFPLAPPRFMVDWGFVDTITLHSNSYRVMQPPSLVNQYAAMPSLHAGWDLLMGIALATHASRRLVRAIGWVLPVLMVLAIVLTANHYFLDAIVGSIVALTGLVVARRLPSLRPPRANRALRSLPAGARRPLAAGTGD